MSRRAIARRLLALLRPLAPLMAVSTVCRVVNQGLGVAIPALAAAMVVRIGQGSTVAAMIWLLTGLAVLKGTFRYTEQFTGHAVAFRLLARMRIDAYLRIRRIGPAGLEAERTGDLVARVVGDIDRVEPFYAHTIAPAIGGLVVPVLAAAGLAIWVDPVVAAAFLPFPLLIALGVPWVRAGTVVSLADEARRLGGAAAAALTDVVQGSREVAVFDARDTVAARMDRAGGATGSVRRVLARVASLRSLLGDVLAGAAVIVVLVVAAARFEAGEIGAAAVAAAVVTAWVATAPARAVVDVLPDLELALAAAGRLFDLGSRSPALTVPAAADASPGDSSIWFRDVSVRRGASIVLSGVDVSIASGSFVAVVGPSGSGKSTLVESLVRFRDPDDGAVEVGGADLRDIPPSRLRSMVALVPQRPDLFFGTIADNLRLARPGASPDELIAALDRAALGDWVRTLPRGLDTSIGELGETMSGGQRQRLTIARVLLRDPEILVLDEATSELDSATEQRVLQTLHLERGARTLIVVAHRLETVTGADEILVLDRGRLVERGTHQDLVAAGGVYEGLWSRHEDALAET